ncbi:FluC/FEX family fluoride channel [Microbacterium sediminis]|uniref:FluC/FEX family fluoride channel n=1 Tax=Microbacterium sediminis TaxID=904291 RepID=UPI001F0A55E6|nr:CrcB family protein [Microbacterium sediminis]
MTVRFRPRPVRWGLLPLVVAGGAIGVAARYGATAGNDDPLLGLPMIMLVNVLGSGLLGLVVGWAGDRPRTRAFLGTGVLGGFTSYSALAPAMALLAGDLDLGVFATSPLSATAFALLLLIGAVMALVALPVAVAAVGYALGARIAGRP